MLGRDMIVSYFLIILKQYNENDLRNFKVTAMSCGNIWKLLQKKE
jgi:hypothetical protein